MLGSAQAISAHKKSVHLIKTFYFTLPCPVTHVIMERHLHGFTRDGLFPKMHTLDGARRPLVAIIARSGTKMHREVRLRPGSTTQTWADAEVEIVDERDKNQGPLRTMPWSVRQQTPPGTLWEMLPQRKMPQCGDWENSIACETVEKEASMPPTSRTPTRMIRPMVSIRNLYRHWTPWRRNTLPRGHHGKCHIRARGRRCITRSDLGSG